MQLYVTSKYIQSLLSTKNVFVNGLNVSELDCYVIYEEKRHPITIENYFIIRREAQNAFPTYSAENKTADFT